jgi:DNA-binding Lrp family transcriptional regulator
MSIKAYVLLKVSSGNEREVCKKIADLNEIVDTSIIYGEFDIIAKVSIDKLEDLEEFLSESIRNISSIMLTSTMIVAREYKGVSKRNSLKIESL